MSQVASSYLTTLHFPTHLPNPLSPTGSPHLIHSTPPKISARHICTMCENGVHPDAVPAGDADSGVPETGLYRGAAAVDGEECAVHEAGRATGEEGDSGRYFFWCCNAFCGSLGCELVEAVPHGLGAGCSCRTGDDGVYPNAMRTEFGGPTFRQQYQCRFTCSVDAHAGDAELTGHAGDVDDCAFFSCCHGWRECAGEVKRCFHVDRQDCVEVLFGKVGCGPDGPDGGVVDQDIDRTTRCSWLVRRGPLPTRLGRDRRKESRTGRPLRGSGLLPRRRGLCHARTL